MGNLAHVQDQIIHHSANAAAVAIPTISAVLNAPQIFTVTTAVLGIIWYCILIGEKIYGWINRKK